MKPEIEELIETYGNIEKYRQRIADMAKRTSIPSIAEYITEALNLSAKINFGKNRQRAELLKQNELFLEELSGIKNRLGETFFRLKHEEIDELGPRAFRAARRDALSKSDFAEPTVVIEDWFCEEHGSEFGTPIYSRPGTPTEGDGLPESEVDIGRDPFFDCEHLDVVAVDRRDYDADPELLGRPAFKSRCKEKVFERYLAKWDEFLNKWHISINWNGDLQYLHVHSLPSVIVERDEKNHNMPVIIHLGAWATLEDVKEAWVTVEEIMKEARIFRERESEDKIFIRDMIWFRMNKEDATSPSKIAHFWAEKFPKEIDLEVIEKVTGNEDTFENVPLEERLEEVLSEDPKMAELRGRFIEARKAFIRIGLKDKVKKSIKKTEEKIKRLGSEDWDRNRIKVFHRGEPFQKKGEK